MPRFSEESLQNLEGCHPQLQALFHEVIKTYDCKVICGPRGKVAQDAAVAAGRSKTPWPTSKHNAIPSLAVDVVPCPIFWPSPGQPVAELVKNVGRFYQFVGYVKRTAEQMGIRVRSGADWDGDFEIKDQDWDDLPHWELLDA